MSQDLSAFTTAHGPREVEWLGTRLLLRAFLSLRRPHFSSLAFSKECSAQTEWSKAGSIDGNTGGSSLVVGKPAN